VTVTLGPIAPRDVRPLARLHRAAFPGFFLTGLGEPFLAQFYRGFLADPSAVAVVARDARGAVQGAVVGTVEPAGFFGRLVRRQWPGLVAASARAVLRAPRSAARLLRAVRYRGGPAPAGAALLSSLCVTPAAQGRGLGGQLVDAWTSEVARRGATAAYLTTDADGNDAVNAFYRAHGWALVDTTTTHEGRPMNRYTLSLGAR